MSFKWKWVLASFGMQLLVGAFFVTTWYLHFYSEAQARQKSDQEQLLQFVKLFSERNAGSISENQATLLLNEAHELMDPQVSELREGRNVLARMGMLNPPESSQSWIHAFSRLHGQIDPLLFAPIPNSPYSVVIEPKYSRYFSRRDWAVETVIGLTLICALASSMMLLALGNLMVGRLSRLRDKALALQAGQSGVRVVVSGKDEIATLSRAFNDMACAVEEHLEKVKQGKTELELERNRLDTILSSLSTGVAYLDGKSNVQYINKSLAKMCGISTELPEGTSLFQLLIMAGVMPSQRQSLSKMLRENLYSGRTPVELELADGRVLRMRFYVAVENARSENGVLMVDDVSLHKNVRHLQEEVETDPLTRVLNRRGFELALNSKIGKLVENEKLGVIYVDLDGFKAVNDTLGHKAGDQVLKSAASILSNAVRNADVVARLGGDEFAILVNRASAPLLTNMGKRIIESFKQEALFTRILSNHNLPVTCSLGASIYPTFAETAQELIEQADEAMYEAKRSGKNCFRLANELSDPVEQD